MSERVRLRKRLISHSLFPKTSLKRAIDQLGFVQADPIRSPARCQDLILRHRVKDYQAGDLERCYPSLGLEEDFVFAYGFLPRRNRDLLHPRKRIRLTKFERTVIDTVEELGPSQSGDLDTHCGSASVRNGWGGSSKATKRALEKGHHHGYLRVAHREKGIRVYDAAPQTEQALNPKERYAHLLQLMLNLFGPTSPKFILSELRYNDLVPALTERRKILNELVEEGSLGMRCVDDIEYVYTSSARTSSRENDSVKILAPFDPIVRDRDRFAHFWDWTYRFEAYVPAAKRVRGYYAMPVLWQDDVIGWANVRVIDEKLAVEIGYERRPKALRRFNSALEREISEFAVFLRLKPNAWMLTEHPESR